MSQITISVTHAAAVASAGTFTAAYPAGYTAGSFATYGHSIYCRGHQKQYTQDAGKISVSFGATTATITYSGSTAIPAGSVTTVELNIAGEVRAPQNFMDSAFKKGLRMGFAPVVKIDLGAPALAVTNGISASQSVALGASFLLNGSLADASGAFVTLDVPRNVVAAWTTTSILTITGEDEYGNTMVEKSASGASHTGKKAFKKITSVSSSASITSATIGTGDVLGLPVYVDKVARILAEKQDGAHLSRFSNNKMLLWFDFNQTDLLAPTAQAIVAPCAGYITGIRAIVEAAVTTGGVITVEANTVAVVGLSITVADADAAGVTYTSSVAKIATGLCAAGDDLSVTPGAPFATAGRVRGYIVFEPTAETNGTFVAGVQTTPTATTGDVRGTYDPTEACNGSLAFSLLVELPDPDYKGVAHFAG